MGGGAVHVAAFGVTVTVAAAELCNNCPVGSDGMLFIVWGVLGGREIEVSDLGCDLSNYFERRRVHVWAGSSWDKWSGVDDNLLCDKSGKGQ